MSKIVNGITYHKDTPDAVIAILEKSRKEKLRIVLTYGDPISKKEWESCTPERGHVGNSTGTIKIPLLIRTRRSLGGEGILDHRIVKIVESKGGRVLYKA
jgi:uncharacterized protein (UPF0248 family)